MALPDVLVAGAGVIGLSIAWRASQAGAQVTVVDPRPGEGASFVAAGMLAPVGEALWGEERLLELNLRSAAAWPAHAAELEAASGLGVGYRPSGALLVGLDAGDRTMLEELHRFQSHLGLDVSWQSGSACRELEPLLAPGIRGGILAARDHQVDPRQVLEALAEACRQAGVTTVRASVDGVVVERGRVTGVVAGGERRSAAQLVLAAGCWSGALEGLPDEARPAVRPLKGQILQLWGPPEAPVLARVLRCVVGGHSCYLLPRADGRLVLGSTSEEKGFDTTVTAGAVYELLRDATRAVPAVAELELREARAGLRPASPDNLPIVGRTPVGGLVLATGHGRNGILLSPVTADLALAAVRGEEPPAWAAACRTDRPGALRAAA
jgi:glycine oxidase